MNVTAAAADPATRLPGEAASQSGFERLIVPQPVGVLGLAPPIDELAMIARLDAKTVFMMGDNPALPRMPERPQLLDFFRLRMGEVTFRHLLQSANLALEAGQDEKIVLACLLHDISNGLLIRTDHGYWGAQLIEPYVDPEIAWAVRYHQALRYFADESVGYAYPEAYRRFFGDAYRPPEYLEREHEIARTHRWYMSARLITIYDIYSFEEKVEIDPERFADIVGRHFRQPEEGLGFDGSPVAHMWRTLIWPNNFL